MKINGIENGYREGKAIFGQVGRQHQEQDALRHVYYTNNF